MRGVRIGRTIRLREGCKAGAKDAERAKVM